MVRKQLYLDEGQNEALKRRAKQLGVSEAEVVRRALDAALLEGEGVDAVRRRAAADFLQLAEELSNAHRLPDGYRFDRQALYEEDDRFKRWDEKA